MATTIKYPRADRPASPAGFTAWGRTDSAAEARRIRGVIIGDSGAVYAGEPEDAVDNIWRLRFPNHLSPTVPLSEGRYVLLVLDALQPLQSLERLMFEVRTCQKERPGKYGLDIADPLDDDHVDPTFIAQGTSTGTTASARMTCNAGHQIPNSPPPPQVINNHWDASITISATHASHNTFTLNASDNQGGSDTSLRITVDFP